MCERWVGNWTDCNILTPSSSVFSSTSFSFCWAAQLGVLRAQAPCWELVLTASNCNSNFNCNWLQLTQISMAPGYIIVWDPPASCECRICTKFNPSMVKVISWYLRPDAPVIYTGASLIWQLGRGSICNTFSQRGISPAEKDAITADVKNSQGVKIITINNIINKCSKLVQSEYKTKHDWVGRWSTGNCVKNWNLIILPNDAYTIQNPSLRMRLIKFSEILRYKQITCCGSFTHLTIMDSSHCY